MNGNKKIFMVGMGILFSLSTAYAQTIQKQIEEPANYKEKKEDIAQQMAKPQKDVYRLEAIEATGSTPEEDCFEIEKIDFVTSTLLSDDEKAALVEPYLGECNAVVKLDNLTKEITNYYRSRGYITSKAFLQPQDLSDGEIEITVVEGKIEKVLSETFYTGLLFPFAEGSLFNVDDYDAGMEQLNRLKAYSAKLALEPGSKPGYSIMKIETVEERSPYTVYVHMNSYYMGAKSHKSPLGVGFDWENPFGISDQFTAYLNTFRPEGNKDSALGSSVSYAFAVPYVVFTLGYSEVSHDQSATDMNYTYDSSGRSRILSLAASHMLFENNRNRLEGEVALAKKDNQTFLPLFAQKTGYKLSVASLALRHTYFAESYSVGTALGYHMGLDLLGAEGAGALENTFSKYVLDLELTKYFAPGLPLIYNLAFYAQQSGDALFGAEQISMGGPYTVRGFKEHGLAGNSGMYFRNELMYEEETDIANLYPYIAWDYGRVECEAGTSCGDMHGAAVGLRAQEYDFNFDLYYSFPVKKPNRDQNTGLRFFGISLTLNY